MYNENVKDSIGIRRNLTAKFHVIPNKKIKYICVLKCPRIIVVVIVQRYLDVEEMQRLMKSSVGHMFRWDWMKKFLLNQKNPHVYMYLLSNYCSCNCTNYLHLENVNSKNGWSPEHSLVSLTFSWDLSLISKGFPGRSWFKQICQSFY